MTIMKETENISDNECVNLISELIQRLKVVSYAKGYKDGFNDGKKAESDIKVYVGSEGQS